MILLLLTLKAGTPLMAREISAVIFVKHSSERTAGSSPISNQMVKRRGTVWYMNLFPYFIAFVKQRMVASRIRSPLPIVNTSLQKITMHVPDLGVRRRYGVETMILVLPIVKHTTFPSIATSEQEKVPRNMRRLLPQFCCLMKDLVHL